MAVCRAYGFEDVKLNNVIPALGSGVAWILIGYKQFLNSYFGTL
jgi:hypothetical protein